MLTNWVNAGGNLDCDAARQEARLAVRARRGVGRLRTRTSGSTRGPHREPGSSASTMQFHGTSDRYLAEGATAVATLYSSAGTATLNPAVTLRSVGSSGGQAAAFTYDLARSVVYTRQGNPAWAGQERDGVIGVRSDDMFFSRLAEHEQDRDTAGRRAAAAAREPDHGDGARPAADAAVLVPAARGEGGRRDERRRPLADQHPRRDRVRLRPVQAAERAGLRCGELGLRPLDLVHLPRQRAHGGGGGRLRRGRLRGRRCTPRTGLRRDTEHAGAVRGNASTQLGQFGARYTGVPAPVSSRTHCVEWLDWASVAKIELQQGIRMDANYYHFPGSWIGARPGFMTGGGFPMRFADTDGTLDRRLSAEHEHERRGGAGLPGDDQCAAGQRHRGQAGTTAPSARTSTPTTPRSTRCRRRSSRPHRHAASR